MAAAVAAMGMGAADASATTFCVPNYTSACPNSGGNVHEADPEKAMSLQSNDGVPDRVVIAAGTFTETGSFEPSGGKAETYEPYGPDPVVIEGSGPGATILTSGATGGSFVFNFASAFTRPATMRDLTVQIPASMEDGSGAGLQLDGSVLENVDIVSLNLGSQGIPSAVGPGNVFRNGELRGEAGGSISQGWRPNSAVDGSSLLVEDSTIVGAGQALLNTGEGTQLTARRVRVIGAQSHGGYVTGGTMTIENSVMTIDDGVGLYTRPAGESATVNADQVTIVNSGGDDPAIEVTKVGGEGDAGVTVANSILRGFGSGYRVETPIGPGIGHVSLDIRYSNLVSGGTNVNGILDVATGYIDVDPLLAGDLSLPPGSPSIDAGDPAPAGLATDFLGAVRPTDGNGDGVARRDQGAFEYQSPAPPPPTAPVDDFTAPKVTIKRGPGKKLDQGIAKFAFKSSEAGSTFSCKLDRRKAAKCKSPKTYKGLKPGRHTFKVWATDVAGNKSKPAKRSFRVPG
jgi:hypothetical protein